MSTTTITLPTQGRPGHNNNSMKDFAQSLNRVEQHISLSYDCLILCILERRPVCFNDAVYFVDCTVQTAGGDEAGELTVGQQGSDRRGVP